MTPEKLREAAELLAQNSVRAFPKELESAIKLAADACTTLADMLTDASVDFEGFDECEGAAISKKTIDNPTPQNIYDYGKAVWQAALALCERNRAAQMESATHGFDEWVLSWGRSHAIQESEGDVIEWVKAAWHAAQAAMQAKLDAANERVKELEWLVSSLERGDNKQDNIALATAERNVELLRGEVRRCWELMQTIALAGLSAPIGSTEDEANMYQANQARRFVSMAAHALADRSPEARALVDTAGPSGATG